MNKRKKKKCRFIRPKEIQRIKVNKDDILIFTFPKDITPMELHHTYNRLAQAFPNNLVVAVEHGTSVKVVSKGELNDLQSIQNSNEETNFKQTNERVK